MNSLDAAKKVLEEIGKPMRVKELSDRILERDLWKTSGLTPERTINAEISKDINKYGMASCFQRVSMGVYALRAWGFPEYASKPFKKKNDSQSDPKTGETTQPRLATPQPARTQKLSFTDAVEQVLDKFGDKKPMHYEEITRKALELGLLKTDGQTPHQTMYAQILTEIKRKMEHGETPRFIKHGKGLVGLSRWIDQGLANQIEQHNKAVRKKLRERLYSMTPGEFEDLIGALLTKIGFEDVQVTARSGDGGIDVRGTLVVGGVISTNMAIQVKRWKKNVQADTVREVRGSLGTHEQALIITTSDFSDPGGHGETGARGEAKRPNAIPVALMNGEQLVALLVENELGVRRASYDLIELDDVGD